MEDSKPLSEQLEVMMANEATRNASEPEQTISVDELKAAEEQAKAPKISNAMRKKMRAQQKSFQQMYKNFEERREKDRLKLLKESKRMKDLIGREDYNALKDICTVHTPEQKDEKGEVTTKASSFVNHKALIEEAKLVLVLQREERIKAGLRKRSTGRSSDRQAHRSTMNFIHMRNDDTLKKETLKTT
jgi:hypothetical protein